MAGDCGRWTYSGDMNLEYGGTYFDLTDWEWGYVEAIDVTDLWSAIGFEGAVLIEHRTIGVDDPGRIRRALGSWDFGGFNRKSADPKRTKEMLRLSIAECMMRYWGGDTDDVRSETIQTLAGGAMSFDGWNAGKRIRGDLEAYVRAVHLGHKTPVQRLRERRCIRSLPFKRDADPGIVADWLDDIGETLQAAEMRRNAGIACGS